MLPFLRSSVVFLLLASTVACGDEGETEQPFGPGCEEGECGGDVTGSWQVLGGCATDSEKQSNDCTGLTCTVVDVQVDGSYDFDADGAASFGWQASVATACSVPKSCIEVRCSELQTAGRTCRDEGESCACNQTDEDAGDGAGQWSTEGGLLQISDGQSTTGTSSWCVSEDNLAINVLASRSLQFDAVGFGGLATLRLTATRR